MSDQIHTILNVDDNEQGRYLVSRQLRHAGFRVIEAATGAEALKLMSEDPDVVLLDVNLPDINGFEVCRRIRETPATASATVIHLSAHRLDPSDQVRGLEGGADAYLTEPIETPVLVATIRSMIRIREAEEKAMRLRAELQAKVEELEEQRSLQERFVSTLTHDLLGPLTAARVTVELEQKLQAADVVRVAKLGRVLKHLDRASDMISNLLDANLLRARGRLPISVAACDLRVIASDVVEDMESLHGKRFLLEVKGNCEGMWSRQGLRRILDNLVSNAVKYGDPESAIEISLDSNGTKAQLRVRNRGNVIPAGDLAFLFEPFRRSDSARASGSKGWGLGLSLVRGLAEAHGGSVQVISNEQHGTEFMVELPCDARLGLEKA